MTPPSTTLTIVIPIFAWSIYRRIKRNIGRQHLRIWRVLLSLTIFSALVTLFGVTAAHQTKLVLGLAGGIVTGIPLAFWGLKLTRFEFTPGGNYYTPNMYIGLGLSLMLAGRISYRLFVLNGQVPPMVSPPPQYLQSALTLYLFGITAGYYLTYYSGVLKRWHAARPSSEG